MPAAAMAEPAIGIAMHGDPALAAGFDHLPYADPKAPKGGRITYGFQGTFDSLNPFIVKGNAPRGIFDSIIGNNVVESLMTRSADEPFTLYGLLAKTVEVPEDRSWIEFHLDPLARFSDGKPVTIDDVLYSVDLLRDKGRPYYRSRFEKIAKAEKVGADGVRFTFVEGTDRELPMLIALLPVLPKHATDPQTFEKSSMDQLVGSGPYTIGEVRPGSEIRLERNPDYWAKDLPVKRGFDNFDEIRVDYFRDENALFEAFKKGDVDIRFDNDPNSWARAYDFPAATDGRIVKDAVETGVPKGMNAFVFNTRRKPFDDERVRKALILLFDFEWVNHNLYSDSYTRTASFFQGSSLSAFGTPASEAEKALLAPFPDAVEPDVMDGSYAPPKSDGSGRDRKNLRAALDLLKSAGFALKGRDLVDSATGQPFRFEFMAMSKEQERLALAYQSTLRLVGIDMSVRTVDPVQFWDRQKTYDFDMMQMLWTGTLSPGREQLFRWSSEAAKTDGTFNTAGVSNPAVDAMIAAFLQAVGQDDFENAVRAFDRTLMSGHYVLPLFHLKDDRIAHWARIKRPDVTALTGFQTPTWWFDGGAGEQNNN
ncbi:extracellular solute-binding protein [Hartmannibacter diazotrophicus]|nr:extracellular solute-binding protein [Hartmannibacter diazotrophicus]